MHTIAILSQKGGTGKTTLAAHLAEALSRRPGAGEVVLVDMDPQASATQWGQRIERTAPGVLAVPPGRLMPTLQAARDSKAGYVVIDTAPHSEQGALTAAKAADLVLLPTRYGGFDLDALSFSADILALAKKPGYVVLNAFPTRGQRMVEDAIKAIIEKGLQVAPPVLTQRAAYRDASITGLTAFESDPNSAAAEEIAELEKWVVSTLKRNKTKD